jgi:hypothetical protein
MEPFHPGFDPHQLLAGADIGHHDLRPDIDLFPQGNGRGLKDSLNLHVIDFREGDAAAHPPVAQHGVVFGGAPGPGAAPFFILQEFLIQTLGLDFA